MAKVKLYQCKKCGRTYSSLDVNITKKYCGNCNPKPFKKSLVDKDRSYREYLEEHYK